MYTPILAKNPTSNDGRFYGYRYLRLQEIIVGGNMKHIPIPIEEQLPGST
jgi:hypothetical protein